MKRNRRRPLPIEEVPEVHHDALALVHERVDDIGIYELHAPSHLVVGDVKQFERLDEIIGKIMIESALDVAALGRRLIGKRSLEIGTHHAPAIAHYAMQHHSRHSR